MKNQRLLIVITVFNLILLLFSVAQTRAVMTEPVAPVLRGRALEIVDDKGRVRASITVLPGDPKFKMPDGTVGYPESVLLRLISPEGRPNVKLGASAQGSGLGLGGEDDPTYVQILAQGSSTSIKLTNKDGREQVIKP
ncbi:MAG TPA: hypothetical protein VGN76_08210 [Gemmatimonadales bacterium]|jgi:hypothetical protein|nr:hypothetical protein [Gemmatimonadales bacterium]